MESPPHQQRRCQCGRVAARHRRIPKGISFYRVSEAQCLDAAEARQLAAALIDADQLDNDDTLALLRLVQRVMARIDNPYPVDSTFHACRHGIGGHTPDCPL